MPPEDFSDVAADQAAAEALAAAEARAAAAHVDRAAARQEPGMPHEAAPAGDPIQPARRKSRSGTSRAERKARSMGTGSTSTPRERAPRSTAATRAQKVDVAGTVNGLHQLAGGLILPMVGKPATGAAFVAAGPDAGKVWAALAKRYPMIEKLFSTGGDGVLWVQLAMVYYPLISLAMSEKAGSSPAADPLAFLAGLVPQQQHTDATDPDVAAA